ncbi:hypothetical protein CYMTET_14267 [Cymbomonas tetramitiformis]|uniref:C-CAP/cofactor C-like domain-containing protein n=1 Tax=Cymbomonas tetramitiformis TaxID=36881 RepID=A0AAE0LA22_9CHLO|nr:hypothetical protein CYMTET_14267 [Cymbomonas tetramitiformis]
MGESKREMLKRVKEEYEGTSSKANQFLVEHLESTTKTFSQKDLPELPVLHLKNNKNCELIIPEETKIVKLLVEDCHNCTVTLNGKVATEVAEVWSCNDTTVILCSAVKTLQVDLCKELTVKFSLKSNFGSLVQAGIYGLHLRFADSPSEDMDTDFTALKEQYPDINDQTDQFITRLIDGVLCTEQIVRLKNEFPTTMREQNAFEQEQTKNAEAMEDAVRQMLGSSIGEQVANSDQRKLEELAEAVSGDKGGIATKEDRADYKKNQGNDAFKAGNHLQATVFYTEAIVLTPDNHIVYSNRCACFLKTGEYGKALQDAEKSLELDPSFVKGHFRKGLSLSALERYDEAGQCFAKTLELDPKNKDAKNSLQMVQMKHARKMREMAS